MINNCDGLSATPEQDFHQNDFGKPAASDEAILGLRDDERGRGR